MREDQIARLRDLEEKLVEVILEEADPEFWPGAGKMLADMTNEERGNRLWSKRNAAATFVLLNHTSSAARDAESKNPLTGNYNPRPQLDEQIKEHEKQAAKMIEAIQAKAKTAGRGA